jgi:hypothetical protein
VDVKPGDARRHFRPVIKLGWPIRFATLEPDAPIHNAVTVGISVGGTFIRTAVQLEVGTRLRLWLDPPSPVVGSGPPTLPLHGEVRWTSNTVSDAPAEGFGMAFRALTARDEVTLHGYFSAALKLI